ncbi:unnamed protein product [Vitrella brassicaformis CCMP3155]|uniref:Uncharacterized protein n=1 Tax=Vitrella brassicaformis (strain CCMP3155) TaxID=1169540 RepID=A0A0G4E9M1_VITBC|nr:unnamed protein product [Vitrella brassicaformis CCMP3155]|eukprot:CEL92118.1 unnamed protein product [Vitrella brassicaformis CCMP3155]
MKMQVLLGAVVILSFAWFSECVNGRSGRLRHSLAQPKIPSPHFMTQIFTLKDCGYGGDVLRLTADDMHEVKEGDAIKPVYNQEAPYAHNIHSVELCGFGKVELFEFADGVTLTEGVSRCRGSAYECQCFPVDANKGVLSLSRVPNACQQE